MQYVIYEDLCLDSLYNLTLTINALFDQNKKYKRQYKVQPQGSLEQLGVVPDRGQSNAIRANSRDRINVIKVYTI